MASFPDSDCRSFVDNISSQPWRDQLDVAIAWIQKHLAPADVFENVHADGDCDHSECVMPEDLEAARYELHEAANRIKELEGETNAQQITIDNLESQISKLETELEHAREDSRYYEEQVKDLENELAQRSIP